MSYFWKANQDLLRRLEKVIKLTLEAIKTELGKDVISVLLIGSLSRGEGIWKGKGDRVIILSDLDLLLITKWQEQIPGRLFRRLKEIEQGNNISIELKTKPAFKIKLLPRDTHTFDICQTAKVLLGKDILYLFPKIDANDLGVRGIEAIFFNRAMLNIEKCSPKDLFSSSTDDLLRLSYLAAKTMFTCTDIIVIHRHCYSPNINQRIRLGREHSNILGDRKEQFLDDIETASKFVFEDSDKLYIRDIYDYWVRVRTYLISLFLMTIGRRDDLGDFLLCSSRPSSITLPYLEKVRLYYKRWLATYVLYKKYGCFKLFRHLHPMVYCRITALLLYIAVDKDEKELFTRKALEYFSNIFRFKNKRFENIYDWEAMRNRLSELRGMGLF